MDRSVPFVRFRVERELDRAELGSAEGKDRLIDALRPVFAGIPPSAIREELIAHVADRIDISPALVGSWLAGGSSASPQRAPRPQVGTPGSNGAAASRPQARAIDAAARAERDFLVQVVADPAHGRQALAELDLEATFSGELARRAAAHLRDHPGDPTTGVA